MDHTHTHSSLFFLISFLSFATGFYCNLFFLLLTSSLFSLAPSLVYSPPLCPPVTRQQEGEKKANYWGSLCMASTVRLGNDAAGNAVHVPLRNMLPTVHPNDLVLGGWDICSDNLAAAMSKASVLVSHCSTW